MTKKSDFPVIGTYDLQPRRSYKMIPINCLQFKGEMNLKPPIIFLTLNIIVLHVQYKF